jgi:phenazine biosynthesis protein phzE
LHRLTQALFEQKNRAFYGICLGHQIICHHIGLPIAKLPVPCQGVQRDVDIFGARRRLGFYNTFSARAGAELAQDIDLSIDENGFVSATRGSFFGSIQAHPESVLSKDGYEVLVAELSRMLC